MVDSYSRASRSSPVRPVELFTCSAARSRDIGACAEQRVQTNGAVGGGNIERLGLLASQASGRVEQALQAILQRLDNNDERLSQLCTEVEQGTQDRCQIEQGSILISDALHDFSEKSAELQSQYDVRLQQLELLVCQGNVQDVPGHFQNRLDSVEQPDRIVALERLVTEAVKKADRVCEQYPDMHAKLHEQEERLKTLRTMMETKDAHQRWLTERVQDSQELSARLDKLFHDASAHQVQSGEQLDIFGKRLEQHERVHEELRSSQERVLRNGNVNMNAELPLALDELATRLQALEAQIYGEDDSSQSAAPSQPTGAHCGAFWTKIVESEQSINNLMSERSRKEDQICSLRTEIDHLTSKSQLDPAALANCIDALRTSERTQREFQLLLDSVTQEVNNHSDHINTIQDEIAALSGQTQAAPSEDKADRSDLEALVSEITPMVGMLQRQEATQQEMRDEVQKCKEDSSTIVEKLNYHEDAFLKLQKSLDECRQDSSSMVGDLGTQIKQIQRQVVLQPDRGSEALARMQAEAGPRMNRQAIADVTEPMVQCLRAEVTDFAEVMRQELSVLTEQVGTARRSAQRSYSAPRSSISEPGSATRGERMSRRSMPSPSDSNGLPRSQLTRPLPENARKRGDSCTPTFGMSVNRG